MVSSITAFCIRIYIRSLTFQEILVFSSYSKVVGFFGLHLCEILVILSIICPWNFIRIRKKVIYLALFSCFLVIIFDDIFLRK